jgi:hypothetical protein
LGVGSAFQIEEKDPMADFDVHYDPITLNVNPTTVEIEGLDDIKSKITLETPQPLKAETKFEFMLPQPFKTELLLPQPFKTESKLESKAELDVKPLVFDQCLNVRFGPLPPTCVRQPYQQHFGITLFGVEIWGVTLKGETQTVVDHLPSKPQVVWGGAATASHSAAVPATESVRAEAPLHTRGGLRIRLG